MVPSERAARAWTAARVRRNRLLRMVRNPSATSWNRRPGSAGGRAGSGSLTSRAAEAANDAALTAKAGPASAMATRPPAAGARAIWDSTAADHTAELAPTTLSSPARAGTTLAAAGLKNTVRAERPKAAA